MATPFTDDKSPICIPFILNRLQLHHQANASSSNPPPPPLIIGLNGLQGVGKSTLVGPLAEALERKGIPTLVCSIDDFYLTHEQQLALARENPENALWQVRGEPGTHDIPLLKSVFSSLLTHTPTSIPQYDKALFSGQGGRLPASTWKQVNQQQPPQNPLQVVILEGWCIGFRPISPEAIAAKHSAPSRTLQQHRLEHLLAINEKLGEYDDVTHLFDAFLHIDSEDTEYVYGWRQEQEDYLRLARGDPNAGMTKEQVVKFVDAYYPAYELYSEGLRNGLFTDKPGAQLRMVVGRDRKVKQVIEI
ncbi:uncharacterized protein TRIVIDRAFT_51992 [Trichoderma virens Gv29-8]|uniref:SRP54-type proteins GTP-binding domain-containing protein n=1 Tax=Hypocrea virens (strain Gv29-8 / FGSC 10586) TaxID=413071 RepID=G9MW54_HYPVG|nr:uncharacterized protein TRIVIDRAFT_51992 [Trichoderma virens Gv29-8]EHK21350.1 hypothetical protein TRIVIDRAFT_51992 [Trichoderma virens Gv29-8]